MTSGRRRMLAFALLFGAAGAAFAQEALPDPASLAALKKEVEDAYLEIQRDFTALTGPRAAETVAALEAAVADEARARAGTRIPPDEFPPLWTRGKILGPIVAGRLAARLPEATVKAAEERGGEAATLGDALRIALKGVFPESTMPENWDRHFSDLEVVRRWTRARGPVPPVPDASRAPEAPDPADMVLVPRGDLLVPDQRGRGWANTAQKAEKRGVRAFYLDRTEVTGAAYAEFLRENKTGKAREKFLPLGWKFDDKGALVAPDGTAALPVAGVSYEGAKAFADSLGKRLPSEDEWERAARGNGGLKYPWGPEFVEGNAVVGGKAGPAPAGSTAGDRSPFGAMDMCGNLSEFCATQPDGKAVKGVPPPTEQVVIRGGNFRDSADEAANDWRYVIGPSARSPKVGFRCAMDERDYEKRFGRK